MNEERVLAEIIKTLTSDHGCHAVILYGSRARGDFQPTSDWDVVGIRETGATTPRRVARAFHGAWLDAFVYAEAAFRTIDPELLRLLPACILVDQHDFAGALIARVTALDQQGPPPLPEGEDEMARVWYVKMLARIARGDLESKYRRVELLFKRWRTISSCAGSGIVGPRRGCRGWRDTTSRRTRRSRVRSILTDRWTICAHWFIAFSPRSDGRCQSAEYPDGGPFQRVAATEKVGPDAEVSRPRTSQNRIGIGVNPRHIDECRLNNQEYIELG